MNLQTYHVLVSTLYLVKIIVYFSAALFLCVKELVISGVNRITSPYNRALVRIFMPGGPGTVVRLLNFAHVFKFLILNVVLWRNFLML